MSVRNGVSVKLRKDAHQWLPEAGKRVHQQARQKDHVLRHNRGSVETNEEPHRGYRQIPEK